MAGRLILYAAASLDGYLADEGGGIAFLDETSLEEMEYGEFYGSIGSIIMGRTTYRQVAEELSPGSWPYEGKPCFVYSSKETGKRGGIEYTALPPKELLERIRRECSGDVWLMGGGKTVKSFMQEGLIDEYRITLIPTLLGGGLPLFPAGFPKALLTLSRAKKVGNAVELFYSARKS
jgi:dihydrofolate reductase